MKRSLLSAIILGGLAVSAQAADLKDSVTDALPAIPDGPITWMGVTFYGTVDVGYAYVNNGANPSGSFYNGAGYTVLAGPFIHGNVSTLNNNALSLSNVGIKIEEQLGYGFLAIGKLETQFNPISGELGDACASLLRYSGQSLYNVENNSDGSRCGQAFANAAYGGISHPIYGTLTVGRQTSLVNDGMGVYDPLALSPAFSAIGYSGSWGGGTGSTETTRWDNSLKYILTYGPFHAAGMYTNGGQDTPIVDDAYGANAGITYAGFSIDGFYTKENGAVNLSRLPLATSGLGFFTIPGVALTSDNSAINTSVINSCTAASGNCPSYLLGTIVDNESWDVMAKYTINVPSFFGEPAVSTKDAPCGGLKDAPCPAPSAKLTFYGGYQYVDQSNPDHAQSYYSGYTTIGGYRYITNPYGLTAFGTDRIRETIWGGLSYEDGPWRFAGGYYHGSQDDYTTGATIAGTANPLTQTQTVAAGTVIAGKTCKQASTATVVAANCSGEWNQGSFLIDYTVNRHFDVYAGFTVTDINGGLANGYLEDNTWAIATGVRVKW